MSKLQKAINTAEFFRRIADDRGREMDRLKSDNVKLKEELEASQEELEQAYEEIKWGPNG